MEEASWNYEWLDNQRLFGVLDSIIGATHVKPVDIDMFAVGLGPGSFAGTRIALSTAQAMALPGHKSVRGVPSGEVMAREISAQSNSDRVVVLGDARRKHVWYAAFDKHRENLKQEEPWALHPVEGLREVLRGPAVVVGPDWNRLGERLMEECPSNCTLIEENRSPTARGVGLLVAEQMGTDVPDDPPTPLYLHPPVFVEPRYT